MQIHLTINIDDKIIRFFKRMITRRKIIILIFVTILMSTGYIIKAVNVSKPYTFTTGNIIQADEINANFDVLYTKINAIDNNLTCPSDMVAVGDFCVDKYEASVWNSYTTDTSGTQYGSSTNDYPCNVNGNDCSNIYARSISGVYPSAYITQFQAQQACLNSGKHLISNSEWQAAVAGTPDDSTSCAINVGATEATNNRTACVSRWGVYNMVGNLQEWTSDWMVTGTNYVNSGSDATQYNPWPAGYGTDASWNLGGRVLCTSNSCSSGVNGLPAVPIRGGRWNDNTNAGVFTINLGAAPSFYSWDVGFRCARRR